MDNWNNLFNLNGKTILITGASSGIGKEIAISCANMGASVIINGRNTDKLKETRSLLSGDSHCIIPADLTNFNLIPDIVSQISNIDGVVLSAGINELAISVQLTTNDIDRIMNINFKAPVLLISELLRQKKIKKHASIVFIASNGADTPIIGNGIYSASKGAIISFSKCLMLELAPKQIRVNCISPSMVWTDLIMNDAVTSEQLKEDEKKYPLKRYGRPADIAGLAVYLLSDVSEWMTGSNLKITGGAL